MTALRHPDPISVENYLAGEETSEVKHEYLGGVVHAMAGATVGHNRVAVNFGLALGSRLRGQACETFNSDTKVRIRFGDHVRFYYPDGLVVCDSNSDEDSYQDQPVVIVEVLSESTRRTDLGEKRDAYLAIPSLKVLLLIESGLPWVQAERRDGAGEFAAEWYQNLEETIPLPEVGAELPMAELYDRMEFAGG